MKQRIVLLLILILGTATCAREKEPQDQPAEEPTSALEQAADRSGGEVVSKREITLTESAAPQQPPQSTARQPEQQRLLTLESIQIMPEDFEIGPLADLVGVDRSTQEMLSVATSFLNTLQEGSVAEESLQADVRQELATSIRYYLERDLIPVTYRIGAVTTESHAQEGDNSSSLEQRTAWMNLRLFGSPGVTEGELYLERSGGRWYISDLQIDFERMGRDYVREQERYYPSTYGWGIE